MREEAADVTPFGTLLHFGKDDGRTPRAAQVLLVAPLSGHFATLLRGTVRTLLPDHDVYITDWHNARDVPLAEALRFRRVCRAPHPLFEVFGPGTHVVAVCQPCVAALAATAVMAEAGHPAPPRSLTLMAGPIDSRVSPRRSTPRHLQAHRLVRAHPDRYGAAALSRRLRRVYPGFVQLTAFMNMNLDRHLTALRNLYAIWSTATARRPTPPPPSTTSTSPCSTSLRSSTWRRCETSSRSTPGAGLLDLQGRRVEPAAIRRTALLTVEGEHDDICSLGQTFAAHDLCRAQADAQAPPPPGRRRPLRRVQRPALGHEIYPIVHNLILANG